MKKTTLLFILIFCNFLFSQGNKKEYDYIKDYYQFVYEGQYNYEIGNDTLAYNLLKKAESNCPLLNQSGIYEIDILARLSAIFGKSNESLDYIEILMKKFGYKFSQFENESVFESLKSKSKWGKLKKNSDKIYKEYLKTVNFSLRNEIKSIVAKDQEIRVREVIDNKELDSIDKIHEERLKVIIKDFGYPYENLLGNETLLADEFTPDINVLITHFKDVEYWKPLFLDLIRKGKAPAYIYGNLVDSTERQGSYFIYAVNSNVLPNEIVDFDKIDERRIAVGLSTWDLQQKMYEIIMRNFKN